MDEDKYRRMEIRPIKNKSIKKETLYFLIFLFSILLILSLMFHWKLFIILTIIILSSSINYFTNLQTFRFDTGQEFFFSLLITRIYGIQYGILLLICAELLPDIITARLDKDTMFSIGISILLLMISNGFLGISFPVIGIILATVKFVMMLILDFMFGFDLREMVCETGCNFVVNLILFAGFGNIFYALLI